MAAEFEVLVPEGDQAPAHRSVNPAAVLGYDHVMPASLSLSLLY